MSSSDREALARELTRLVETMRQNLLHEHQNGLLRSPLPDGSRITIEWSIEKRSSTNIPAKP